MALVLVRLKLTLLRSSLSTSGIQGVLGIIFAVLLAAGTGALGGILFAFARQADTAAVDDIALAVFALLFLGWVFGPVLTAMSDGTLPPERLASFPLKPRDLMTGLLLASAAGFGGLFTVLVLVGGVVGLAPLSPFAAFTVAAVAAELAICIVGSRIVAAAISGAAHTRRWRDLALFAAPVLGIVVNVGAQVVSRSAFDSASPEGATGAWRAARPVLIVLPSGPPALASAWARQGRPVLAAVALVASVAVVAAGLWVWHLVLRRSLTSAPQHAADRTGAGRSLYPWFARFLPRDRTGAGAAKEMRLSWRDPRQRAALVASLFASILVVASFRGDFGRHPAAVLLAATIPVFLAGNATNLFGFDGRAWAMNLAATGDIGRDVVAKVIARAFIFAPLTALAIAVLVWRTGSAAFAPHAAVFAVGAFGLVMGPGAAISVWNPVAVPESKSNVFASGNAGQGFAQAASGIALLLGASAVLVPAGFAIALVRSQLVSMAVSVAVGAAGLTVLTVATRHAAAELRRRGPRLLLALSDRSR